MKDKLSGEFLIDPLSNNNTNPIEDFLANSNQKLSVNYRTDLVSRLKSTVIEDNTALTASTSSSTSSSVTGSTNGLFISETNSNQNSTHSSNQIFNQNLTSNHLVNEKSSKMSIEATIKAHAYIAGLILKEFELKVYKNNIFFLYYFD